MPKQFKLDIDLGENLRGAIVAAAQVAGETPSAYARRLIQDGISNERQFAAVVADAVAAVALAVEPDERYDPADDDRAEEPVLRLAQLLGSLPAAEGVAQALRLTWTRWAIKQ